MVRSQIIPVTGAVPWHHAAMSEAHANQLANSFSALSDPVRLRLLSLIAAAGEICSCDLQLPLNKSQPTISHHTRILAEAGLIVGEKRGRWMWWSVAPTQRDYVTRMLST